MWKQQGWPQPGKDCQEKAIQKCGGASQGVDWGWSYCIKSQPTQTDPGHGLQCRIPLVKPLLNNKQRQKLKNKRTCLLLSGPKSSFLMRAHFASHLETKVPESGGRLEWHTIHDALSPVWIFQSVLIWEAMSSAGVGPLCFIKSRVKAAIYQDILEHLMLPSADKLYRDADFSRTWHLPTLPKVPKPGSTQKKFDSIDPGRFRWCLLSHRGSVGASSWCFQEGGTF